MVSSSVISGVSEVLKSDAWRPIIKNDAPDKRKIMTFVPVLLEDV